MTLVRVSRSEDGAEGTAWYVYGVYLFSDIIIVINNDIDEYRTPLTILGSILVSQLYILIMISSPCRTAAGLRGQIG